jgi:hypothetical protein
VDAVRQLESALRAIRFRLMVRRAVGWSVRAGWIAAATAAVLLLVGLLVLGAPIGAAILLPAPPLQPGGLRRLGRPRRRAGGAGDHGV